MKLFATIAASAIVAAGATSCNSCSTTPKGQTAQTAAADIHNSRISIDWPGTYKGVLPAADAEGISTVLVLRPDETYSLYTRYEGKGDGEVFTQSGKFSWKEDGNIISLEGISEGSNLYAVGENRIKHLDAEGKEITGELAEHYILTKSDLQLAENYWRLVELKGQAIVPDSSSDSHPYIIFRNDGSINGNAGCNIINGPYKAEGDSLSFGMLISTMMACPNLDLESKFLRTLDSVRTYAIENDRLIMKDADGKPTAELEVVYLY